MTVTRRGFLHGAAALLGSAPLWRRSPTAAQQAVRPAPGLPTPRFVDTNGIRMGMYTAGEGLPVVFCHGFPELAFSWRHQISAFADAGLQVIAPDLRGYGLTDRPMPVDGYSVPNLCADLAGLLDALEIERAVFCGHDWGGALVWMMPRLFPERVAGVIGVNTPASGPPAQSTAAAAPVEEPLIVRTDNYYVRTFQTPGHAEAILERDVRRSIQVVICRGWYWDVENMRRYPEDSAERTMDFLRMIESGETLGEVFLTDAELAYFVETFEVTGFRGGLNYYRNIGRGGGTSSDLAWQIEVPCLYVGAENDTILRPSSADGMSAFIDDLETHVVADCGHWTQQEKPDEFNRVTLEWMGRKFA